MDHDSQGLFRSNRLAVTASLLLSLVAAPAGAALASESAPSPASTLAATVGSSSRVDFYEIRRKSEIARGQLDEFGLTLRTQIAGEHYVVNWGLGKVGRADGNAKLDFQDALRNYKAALQNERAALHQVFGDPKTQNELIFAADIIGRYELVSYTLDSINTLSSFDLAVEWALHSHVVLSLASTCEGCGRQSLIAKLEHFDPAQFNWGVSSEKEVIRLNASSEDQADQPPSAVTPAATQGAAQGVTTSQVAATPDQIPIAAATAETPKSE